MMHSPTMPLRPIDFGDFHIDAEGRLCAFSAGRPTLVTFNRDEWPVLAEALDAARSKHWG